MTKRKTPFFTVKGLSNSPIFQYLNFSFYRHFKSEVTIHNVNMSLFLQFNVKKLGKIKFTFVLLRQI